MMPTTLVTSASAALQIATVPTCFVISLPPRIDSSIITRVESGFFTRTTYTASTTYIYSFPATTDTSCVQPRQAIPTGIIPNLTPKIATASTCVFVSVPQETGTITVTAGTPLAVSNYTIPAIITAACYNSMETIPALTVPVTEEGIKCSSITYPEDTLINTFTFDVVSSGILSKTTRTVTETSTSIVPAYTNVQCTALPNYENIETCDTTTPSAWAVLVITFISIQLTWWIFDIPLLWEKDGGFRAFLDSISWACLRAPAAGSAGAISACLGSDSSEFEWKTWKPCTCVATDLLNVVISIITLKEACTLPQADVKRQFGAELWVYPSLPAAIIGLSLLLGERLFPRNRRGN